MVLYAALAMPLLTAALLFRLTKEPLFGRLNLVGAVVTSALLILVILNADDILFKTHSFLYVDSLSAVILAVVAVLNVTAALASVTYMERETHEASLSVADLKRYYILLNIFIFSMICVPVVENLGLLWVAVEATTLASALLVAFSFSRAAIEAAWKYVMICTVGLCLGLLGTILLYSAQLSVSQVDADALSWLALMKVGSLLDGDTLKIAFVFIVIGYGAKAGLAPMHTWLPDAHSQAPSPISGILSGALLTCSLYAIMRNMAIVHESAIFPFVQQLLIGFGLLSILVVIPFMLVQHDIKRLLAYSSVEHMGIITLALGIGSPLAVYGALIHIFNHAVAKSALFYLVGTITQEYKTKQIMRIRGMMKATPLLGWLLLLLVLIITGAPPFGIFFSKLIIAWAAFAGGFAVVGTMLLVLLGAVFAGMLYYVFQMDFAGHHAVPEGGGRLAWPMATALGISLAVLAVSGWYLPQNVETILRQAVTLVMGG